MTASCAPFPSLPKAPMTLPPPELDFRLDGYEAVNERVAEHFRHYIKIHDIDFAVLAEHHTDDNQHSYYVLRDNSATWGIPGEPQLVALYLKRDVPKRTFRFEHELLPLPAMAQSWLIARGCPKDAIALRPGVGLDAADEATKALEDRLLSDGDHFSLVTSYTSDAPDRMQITVLLVAIDEKDPVRFRVLLEDTDTDTWTRTLREGGFSTADDAITWWEAHWSGEDVPLPAIPPSPRIEPPVIPGIPAPPASRPGPTR